MSKIYAFDYMLSLFENWYNEENKEQNKGFENCSKLSMLKLLFLTAVPKEEGARDLLDIFDNFHALPYGPVESDIYNAIQDKKLPSYIITERSITKKENVTLLYNVDDYSLVKDAIDALKMKNRHLILLNAFDLVKITHKWESWKQSINFAKLMDMSSYKMTVDSDVEKAKVEFKEAKEYLDKLIPLLSADKPAQKKMMDNAKTMLNFIDSQLK